MGRKKTSAMTLATSITIGADINIAKDDIVAVAVAQHDINLEIALIETKDRIKELQTALERTRELIAKECGTAAKAKLEKEAKAIVTALVKAGYATSITSKITGRVTKIEDDDSTKFVYKLTVGCVLTYKDTYNGTLTKKHDVKLPAGIKKLVDRETMISDVLIRTKERQVSIIHEQKNMHRVELRAKAQLAKATLQTSKEGRDILAQIEDVKIPTLPTLPAYTARK